jgi:hypothetical protein
MPVKYNELILDNFILKESRIIYFNWYRLLHLLTYYTRLKMLRLDSLILPDFKSLFVFLINYSKIRNVCAGIRHIYYIFVSIIKQNQNPFDYV